MIGNKIFAQLTDVTVTTYFLRPTKLLNIHVFATTDSICSTLPFFFSFLLPLFPALVCMIIGLQLMPADGAGVVLVL